MTLRRIHLADFRSFAEATFEPDPEGTTVLSGPNGTGKTTVLEAVAYLGTQRSFRGAPKEAMVRTGCERAVLRAELTRQGAPVLVEAEVATSGRSRAQVNRQPARARRDLAEAVPVTVFSPDDLGVVRAGPSRRRDLLDDALGLLDPTASALADEVERVLRQRGAAAPGGRPGQRRGGHDPRRLGRAPGDGRHRTGRRPPVAGRRARPLRGRVVRLFGGRGRRRIGCRPRLPAFVGGPAGRRPGRGATRGPAARGHRAGPHRDDVALAIDGRDARLQASQGEQRCLALALRLGVHRLVTARAGTAPILLLDDVFSELDPFRARALVHELPAGQALLTTAVPLPEGVSVAATVDVRRLAGER